MKNRIDSKKDARLKRAAKTRIKIAKQQKIRLCIFRSNQHIYAQIINEEGNKILASASSVQKEIKQNILSQTNSKTPIEKVKGSNLIAASEVGKAIADKAKHIGIESVAFDRSGFSFHGRVKALAEAARNNGLKF